MKTSSGKILKRKSREAKRHKLRGTVVKMLAIMESNPESAKDPVAEFLVTGRTGRRNAMADIMGPNASVTSGDLPQRLECLSTKDKEAGPSSSPQTSEANKKKAESKIDDHSVQSTSAATSKKTEPKS